MLRLTVLEAIADLYFVQDEQRQEERVQAITDYQEALALWPQTARDKLTKVRLLRKLGASVYGKELGATLEPYRQPAHRALLEGLRLMADEPPHVETVLLLVALSQQSWRERAVEDWEEAEQYAQRAVGIAEQVNAPSALSTALNALSVVYVAKGLFRQRAQVAQRRLELSRLSDFTDQYERFYLLREVGAVLIDVGDYERALTYLQEAERVADQTHSVGDIAASLQLQAICALRLDRWDDVALEGKLHSLQQRHHTPLLTPNCFHLALIACVHAWRGEKEQAATWRDASFDAMAKAMPPAQWKRTRHY
jgi:tetratricopeptide (TPR) repeat protein